MSPAAHRRPEEPQGFLLAAFGDPGHAFPMLALGRRLAARGHEVTLETWGRWADAARAGGMRFAPAPEYAVFPTRERPLKPYAAAVLAARETRGLVAARRPAVVVADILTLGAALAGELEGVPVASLVPHVHPVGAPGLPPFALGARRPRTPVGRALWRGLDRPVGRGLRQGRDELNEARRRLGLAPRPELHGGLSRELCLVGTLPQLEYPRAWPPGVEVCGPLLWEPEADEVELPPGDGPLVLVAPSTAQDPDHRLLTAALAGLARLPVRVLATFNRRAPPAGLRVPANARLADWLSYARTMPQCDVVVSHAGHGTLVRALASGCAVVACPAGGDQNENAARLDWAGLGVRVPPRLLSPGAVRLGVQRALGDPELARRVAGVHDWAAAHDGATRAADLLEELAARTAPAAGVA